MTMKSKKGQLSLGDAPSVVLIVGLIFLIMATIAFIGSKFGDSIGSDVVGTSVNAETVAVVNAGTLVAKAGTECNFNGFSVINATNSSGTVIASGNYSTTSAGSIRNLTAQAGSTASPWKVSYDYTYGGVACQVTEDLQTEISNNTSIAGIVLTISLVGIVLSILVGVFLAVRMNRT